MLQPEGRRSSIQIIAGILKLLRLGETGKSEIMYTVNMNYRQTQKYLNRLLELGMLDRYIEENHLINYQITEKGFKLLSEIENVEEMLNREELLEVFRTS